MVEFSRALLLAALGLAIAWASGAEAATWTFTPELKRLDAEGSELPEGPDEVERSQAFLADDFGQGMTLETRLAYAMELARRRGLLTFFGELGKSGEFAPSLRLGTQLGGLQTLHSNIDFELYGERLGARLGREPEYGLVFKIRGNF